jgi:hypothetical protein
MLTRQQMVDVINGGGSVLHNGQILTHVSQLPFEEQIAQTPQDKEAAAEKLKAEIELLKLRLSTIEAATPTPEATAPATPAKTPTPAATTPKPAKAEA